MHVLLVAATPFEIAPTLNWLETHFSQPAEKIFEKDGLVIQPLVTGVGIAATAFQMGCFVAKQRPGWVINAGIAGAFDPAFQIGTVVQVITERWGDFGVEESDGRFTDISELGFSEGHLANLNPPIPQLPMAHGLTVQKVHGTTESIRKIQEKYPDIQVESMEGAAFFYACLQAGVPFAEIRAISNRVEARNRDAWDVPKAIHALNVVLREMLEGLAALHDHTPIGFNRP